MLGSLHLCVFQHVDVGFPPPLHLLTRGCWVPSTSASFDTWTLGSLHLRILRHSGIGFPPPLCLSTHWRWVRFPPSPCFRHVGFLSPLCLSTCWPWVPFTSVIRGLAATS